MNADEGWPGPDVTALRLPPADVVEHVIELSEGLKGELIDFAQHPRFSKQFSAALRQAAGPERFLDESTAIMAIDAFVLQKKLHDGTTVVQRFVDQRRPALSAEEKAALLRWQEVVEGCFEVRERLRDGVLLHNLLDDLLYPTWATAGAEVLERMTPGSFVVARVVPAHADFDVWLFSGTQAVFEPEDGPAIARTAMQAGVTRPEAMRRNTELMTMAWRMQAEERAAFLQVAGNDMVVGTPQEMREVLLDFRRLRQRQIEQTSSPKGAPDSDTGVDPEDLVAFSEEILDAASVAVVYDEVEGIHYFADFAAVLEPFAVPAEQLTPALLSRLRDYLNDETVPPFLFRRLAAQHPDSVDHVFATLLGKKGFRWDRDGEALLTRKKPAFADHEPTPSITVTGKRLAELLRTER
ncbi:hypothetical protein ABH926_005078 [Catenulispora sp. GP43]|uniref:hypothetical protein n=1 Tax=Catenulispora sp. GP43 TaxID=3156263 RepID=UPI0035124910